MLHLPPFRMKDVVLRSFGLTSLLVTSTIQVWMFSASQSSSNPAYSINSFLLYLGFTGYFMLNVWWLLRTPLHSLLSAPKSEPIKEDAEPLLETPAGLSIPKEIYLSAWDLPSYFPYYILTNMCICIWAVACHQTRISLAQIALYVALALQLRVALSTFNQSSQRASFTSPGSTLLVSKITIGMLVMYLWRTWGLIDNFAIVPTLQQKIHTGIVFVLLTVATGPDPTVGIAFIYVLQSLYFGTYKNAGWHSFFLIESVVLIVLIVLDSVIIKLGYKMNEQSVDVNPPSAHTLFEDEESSTVLESASSKDNIPMLPMHRQDVSS
ncbi:hypothetical protein EV360DRAFT_74172 [Lentinula raphanica]|nr:hypothetical protein EV360DRAFT_74172 [Lentinula raphanica]